MRIAFVGINILMNSFVSDIGKQCRLFVLQNYKEEQISCKDITVVPTKYFSFGVNWLIKTMGIEVAPPSGVAGFGNHMKNVAPERIVVFDFYRWYFIQCMWYAKRNPSCELYLYAETKAWPKNIATRMMMKSFFRYAKRNQKYITRVITCTDDARTFFSSRLRVPVVTCPIKIDLVNFCYDSKKHSKSKKSVNFIVNARYVPYKRHIDIFKAVVNLPSAMQARIKITCIGRSAEGRSALQDTAKQLGIEQALEWKDSVAYEAMSDVYNQHDVLILSSYNEALGLVVPEAMACGLATITSDTVGANVYVDPDKTGYIYPTGDTVALSLCIKKCITDPVNLVCMQKAAAAHILGQHQQTSEDIFACWFN